ncbi:MAG: molybdopterin-dependent oxidoreductase [Gemmatimonadota bacterium]|jgi:sulfane dehydrogenase subunit SoxC
MASERTDRRGFLKRGAALAGGLTLGGAEPLIHPDAASAQSVEPQSIEDPDYSSPELIAYGQRSPYVTSVREPVNGRPSPDDFGLVFHIGTPLQDQIGTITPSSLHYFGTTRGSFVPNIDPAEHRLLIHGMVDRELIFTVDELKRFPSVTRLHFIECAGNRSSPRHRTIVESHGMTSCSEWTGVPLRTLLEEAGVQEGGDWIIAEGVEEVKGTSSLPMAKAMDDIIVAYGQNGEPLRPQQGFPLRIVVPGFEGILSVKWLRRIKVVDQFYMTYNDYGHLRQDPADAALSFQIGPKSVITNPSGGQQLPGAGFYEVRGLAWSGGGRVSRVEVSLDGGESWFDADIRGEPQRMAHTAFSFDWTWDGSEVVMMSRCTDEIGQVQPTRDQVREFWGIAPGAPFSVKGQDNSIQPWRIERDGNVHNAIA